MVTILHRFSIGASIVVLACALVSFIAYNKGFNAAKTQCEAEKNELIQQKEQQKTIIVEKVRKKTPVERRKELEHYVIQ